MKNEWQSIGLYIHIPFCKAKCHYCDFNSRAGLEHLAPAYFDALSRELAFYAPRLSRSRIETLFIGGGTPSLVDSFRIEALMEACRTHLTLDEGVEATIEANPGTLDQEKLLAFRRCGLNRLSLGLQAVQPGLLKRLGRIHTFSEFEESVKFARNAGFDNLNTDLIFGIPGQTLAEWSETLNRVMDLEPTHVSCYSLKIEEGTPFGDQLARGELTEMEEELDREMYDMAINRLGAAGLEQYEISNFARSGFQCRHNLIYWKAREYLGIGAGAHSYLDGCRFNNIIPVEGYISRLSRGEPRTENVETIGEKEAMAEFMILGLRLTQGIDPAAFAERFGKNILEVYGGVLEGLERRGLLEAENNIRLTKLGLDLANQAFMEFL